VRTLRRFAGAEHNPLLRTFDRRRSALALLTAVLLCGAVAAGVLAGLIGSRLEQGLADRQAAQRQRTTALVTSVSSAGHNSGTEISDGGNAGSQNTTTAYGVWTGPDGRRHSGRITVPSGTAAGSRLTVWTDRRGVAVPAPTSASTVVADGTLTGFVTFAITGSAVLGGAALAGLRIDRRAADAWAREWSRVEPTWTRRR
jgi:hypothetical protein